MVNTLELLDLSKTLAAALFEGFQYPWEVLGGIGDYICRLGPTLPASEFDHPAQDVWIAKDARICRSASIAGPCIIDCGAELRHCAFLRGSAIVGKAVVVGNSVELKNVILFDGAQVPHFNYVGDSILGCRAHMGAGSITSNVKSDRTEVVVKDGAVLLPTGRKKFGAILADGVEIGCNSVLNPGTIVGRDSTIYPLSSVRGVVPARSIYKSAEVITPKR